MSLTAVPTSASSSASLPKITVIYDNRKSDERLREGFGFSCLIEWGDRKVLFDTGGKKDAFTANLETLGIDLKSITHVAFSHLHWDHTAGFGDVLKSLSDRASLYLPAEFDTKLEASIPKSTSVHRVSEFKEISENIYSLVLRGPYWFWTIQEQALILRTSKGLVILTGCAHPGIQHITEEALRRLGGRVHLVLGGFHLYRSWRSTCEGVVRALQTLGVEKVAPCHCAGDLAIGVFSESYRDSFIRTGTGSVIQI